LPKEFIDTVDNFYFPTKLEIPMHPCNESDLTQFHESQSAFWRDNYAIFYCLDYPELLKLYGNKYSDYSRVVEFIVEECTNES
jgi:hypothetical protein